MINLSDTITVRNRDDVNDYIIEAIGPTADDEDEMRWFIFERDWYTEPTSVIEALAVVRLNFGYPVGVAL